MEIGALQLWVIAGVLLLIGEVFTAGFLLVCFSAGAFAAAIVAGVGGDLTLQVAAFAIGSFIAFLTVRPLMKRLIEKRNAEPARTNVDALAGRQAVVTEPVNPDAGTGRVKIDGDDWRARILHEDAFQGQIPTGAKVRIVGVDGATLIIEPIIKQE